MSHTRKVNVVKALVQLILAVGFGMFVVASFLFDFGPGRLMGRTFATTVLAMVGVLPCAFVLIALFDVWVKPETVERHLGHGTGVRGYAWSMLLSGMTVGGLYVAIPMACSLAKKGAHLSIILAYVGFSGVCRIPMILFEASFMGWTFTAVRMAVSIPLVIVTSQILARALMKRGYRLSESPLSTPSA